MFLLNHASGVAEVLRARFQLARCRFPAAIRTSCVYSSWITTSSGKKRGVRRRPHLNASSSELVQRSNIPTSQPGGWGVVPKAGLEPARLSPHAPQTCASTNSATWASSKNSVYRFAGDVGAGFLPLMTEPRGRACSTASAIDVITNSTKNVVVNLCKSVVAPRAPNAVCDPPPPNAPARSAPFPCWTRTTRIRKMLTMTCKITRRTVMAVPLTSAAREFFQQTAGAVKPRK